jgi:ribonuclease VapC
VLGNLGLGDSGRSVPELPLFVESARTTVRSFLNLNGIEYVGIGEREYDLATQAYAEFGKGRHPAALNMGDCFAYACARANRAALLSKGDDFGMTDIRSV